ncbi:MAG: AbrB/MazE/SpoVT family DNA-binding domain-containing protein [Pseudorhodobacter sp.]|nr:AbrB/MazE/SpoVT family DNA-binding domain-containing protein [Rhizobacter sp.]
MSQSTITTKGQTTVPLPIREQLGAAAGTKLLWHVMPDGAVLVRAKTKSVLDLAGMLKAPSAAKGKRVTIDDMNPWR